MIQNPAMHRARPSDETITFGFPSKCSRDTSNPMKTNCPAIAGINATARILSTRDPFWNGPLSRSATKSWFTPSIILADAANITARKTHPRHHASVPAGKNSSVPKRAVRAVTAAITLKISLARVGLAMATDLSLEKGAA
ncbi:MAG: hypothetical protein WCC92_02970 [Candidatus Korobacteraceae bacterium]